MSKALELTTRELHRTLFESRIELDPFLGRGAKTFQHSGSTDATFCLGTAGRSRSVPHVRAVLSVDVAPRPRYPWHMSAQAQAILEQALRLSADERASLADALQRSLDDGGESNLPPEEVARLWNDEIERRLARARERVARGEPVGRTADEVYADAEAKIQAIRASRGG